MPPILKTYNSICDYGAGSGWLRELCAEAGKTCILDKQLGKRRIELYCSPHSNGANQKECASNELNFSNRRVTTR